MSEPIIHENECPHPDCQAVLKIRNTPPAGVYDCRCKSCKLSLTWANDVPRLKIATASDLVMALDEIRRNKPRSLAQRFGKNGPTAEQAETHASEMKAWNRAYREMSKLHKAQAAAESRVSQP